jgi:hypothetical protein
MEWMVTQLRGFDILGVAFGAMKTEQAQKTVIAVRS